MFEESGYYDVHDNKYITDDVVQAIRSLHELDKKKGDKSARDKLNAYLFALHKDGLWTLRVLANAMNNSNQQTISNRVIKHQNSGVQINLDDLPLPDSPRKQKSSEVAVQVAPVQLPEIDKEVADHLKELARGAQRLQGNISETDPRHQAAEKLADAILSVRKSIHPNPDEHESTNVLPVDKSIAQVLGVQPQSVISRLQRYGRLRAYPSSKVRKAIAVSESSS